MNILDYVGVAVFAASGAVKASEKEMDLVEFILTATVTGIGGGTLRDLLLGIQPVFWVTHNQYLIVCGSVAIITFFVAQRLARRDRWLVWADVGCVACYLLHRRHLPGNRGGRLNVGCGPYGRHDCVRRWVATAAGVASMIACTLPVSTSTTPRARPDNSCPVHRLAEINAVTKDRPRVDRLARPMFANVSGANRSQAQLAMTTPVETAA